mmetsp:Transcript_4858/g.11352  ORF Transcript_4858/g.11352 Transcript_4858/m.11352 type:complete len:297 (-) Transcript_4858:1105-1995(-)
MTRAIKKSELAAFVAAIVLYMTSFQFSPLMMVKIVTRAPNPYSHGRKQSKLDRGSTLFPSSSVVPNCPPNNCIPSRLKMNATMTSTNTSGPSEFRVNRMVSRIARRDDQDRASLNTRNRRKALRAEIPPPCAMTSTRSRINSAVDTMTMVPSNTSATLDRYFRRPRPMIFSTISSTNAQVTMVLAHSNTALRSDDMPSTVGQVSRVQPFGHAECQLASYTSWSWYSTARHTVLSRISPIMRWWKCAWITRASHTLRMCIRSSLCQGGRSKASLSGNTQSLSVIERRPDPGGFNENR